MAKRRRTRTTKNTDTNQASNKLQQALIDGKPIKGMLGWIRTNIPVNEGVDGGSDADKVIIKVRAVRVETSCDVRVIATPVGGEGEFYINPCQWFDSKPSLKAHTDRLKRIEEARKIHREIFRSHLNSKVKSNWIQWLLRQSAEHQRLIRLELLEEGVIGEGTDINNYAQKATLYQLKCITVAVMAMVYDLDEGVLPTPTKY